jgi:uncharacterized protein
MLRQRTTSGRADSGNGRAHPRAKPMPWPIGEMVRRIVSRFHPERIVLFGSHARGTAGPDSDVDLLVVMPVVGQVRTKRIEMRMALHDIGAAKDIVLVTPEQYRRQRDIPGTIVHPAVREGKALYVKGR